MGLMRKIRRTVSKVGKPIAALNPVSAFTTGGAIKAAGGGDPLGLFSSKMPDIGGGDPGGLASAYLKYLGPNGGMAGGAFDDWKKELTGVAGGLQEQLLSGIDRDTNKAVGSLKMDFADRGLSGPGQMSDIEGVGLAQARGEGDRAKVTGRLGIAKMLSDAMGERYTNAAGTDKLIAQLLSGGVTNDLAREEMRQKYKEPSLFDKLLDKVNFNFGFSPGG